MQGASQLKNFRPQYLFLNQIFSIFKINLKSQNPIKKCIQFDNQINAIFIPQFFYN